MLDPFDIKKGMFADAFSKGGYRDFHEQAQEYDTRVTALERAQRRKAELAENQDKHDLDLAKKYGAPSQGPKNWGEAIGNIGQGLFGLYQASRAPKASPLIDQAQRMGQYADKSNTGIWTPPRA